MNKPFKIIASVICAIFAFESTLAAAPNIIETITVAKKDGMITHRFAGDDHRSLVLIQDAHNSHEAQLNIASLIDDLTQQSAFDKLSFIGTEGATESYDFQSLNSFPDTTARNIVTHEYVKAGTLTGPELASITARKNLALHGLEDTELFESNYAAFTELIHREPAIRDEIDRARTALARLKNTFFSPALLLLDQRRSAFRNGSLSADTFLPFLIDAVQNRRIDLESFPLFQNILMQLQNNDTDEDTRLKDLDFKAFTHECDSLAQRLCYLTAKTKEERTLLSSGDQIDILDRLLMRQAQPSDVAAMHTFSDERMPVRIADALNGLTDNEARAKISLTQCQNALAYALDFYTAASKRDDALVENMLTAMQNADVDNGIMVFGGYHTAAVEKLLTERGISHVTVLPAIKDPTDSVPFESRMNGSSPALQNPYPSHHFQATLFGHVLGTQKKQLLEQILSDMYGHLLIDEENRIDSLDHIKQRIIRFKTSQNPMHTLLADALGVIHDDLTDWINTHGTINKNASGDTLFAFRRKWGNTLRTQIHFESFENLFLKELTEVLAFASQQKEDRTHQHAMFQRTAPESIFDEFYYEWALTNNRLPVYTGEIEPLIRRIQNWDLTGAQRLDAVRELQKKHFLYSIARSNDKKGHIDLHTHTIYSNGAFTPAHLVFEYWLKGFSALAITDKNTFQGLEEALVASEILGITVIPGFEMPVRVEIGPDEFKSIHVLVYWHKTPSTFRAWLKDPANTAFLISVADAEKKALHTKNKKIRSILDRFNERHPTYHLSEEDLSPYAYESVTTSDTLARALLAKYGPEGKGTLPVLSINEIRRRLIKPLKMAHLFKEHTSEHVLSFRELLQFVEKHSFRVVFAHPLRSSRWGPETIEQVLRLPGTNGSPAFDGIELFYNRVSREEDTILRGIIDTVDTTERLIKTTGSDTFGHMNKKYGLRFSQNFFTNTQLRRQFFDSARILPFKNRAHYYAETIVHAGKYYPELLPELLMWGTNESLGKPSDDVYTTISPVIIDILIYHYDNESDVKGVKNVFYYLLENDLVADNIALSQIHDYLSEPLSESPEVLHETIPTANKKDYFWFQENAEQSTRETKTQTRQPKNLFHLFADQFKQIGKIKTEWNPAVCVFGGGAVTTGTPLYHKIKRIGGELRRRGLGCRTGTGPGTMEAPLIPYGDEMPWLQQGININNFPMNGYIKSAFNFSHFGLRKRAFYENTAGAIICPGGIGTLDELFECLEQEVPLVLFGREFWEPIIDNFCDVVTTWGFSLNRNDFIITDSVTEAVDYIVEHRYRGFTAHKEDFEQIQNNLRDGLEILRDLPPSVVFMGEAATAQTGFDEIQKIISRLIHQRIPVRAGTNSSLFRSVASYNTTLPFRDLLQSTLYFSRDEKHTMDAHKKQYGSDVTYFATDDLSVHHLLSTENAHAFVFMPGGKKTLTNLFDIIANMQLNTIPKRPVILVNKAFWHALLEPFFEGALNSYEFSLIKEKDKNLFSFVDTAEEALAIIHAAGFSTEYEDYSKLIHDTAPLYGIEAVFSDFDGVVHNYGEQEVSYNVRALQKNILAAGIRYITITGRPLHSLISAYGSEFDLAALACDLPYVALTNAGAQAHSFDARTQCRPLEGFPPIELDRKAAQLLESAFIDTVNEVFASKNIGWNDIKGIYGRIHLPYDFNLYLKTDEMQEYRETLARALLKRINALKAAGSIPDHIQVVVTRASVDILVRSKAASMLELVRRYGLRKCVVIGDSVGTNELHGNDRSLLSLTPEDAQKAGISWWKELEFIKIYVGNEEDIELPAGVIRAPKGRFDADAAYRILKHIAEIHARDVAWDTLPEQESFFASLPLNGIQGIPRKKVMAHLNTTQKLTFADVKDETAEMISMIPSLLHKIKTGEVMLIRHPSDEPCKNPFIWYKNDDQFYLSVFTGETIFIAEDLFELVHPGIIEALCDPVLYERFNRISEQKRASLLTVIQTTWSVRKGLTLPGPARPYAETCELLLNEYFDLDFKQSTEGVLDPVVRIAWAKLRVIDHFLEKEKWTLIEDAIRIPRTEQWIDAILRTPDDTRTALLIHQGYFHEGSPLSKVAESIWRFGAGTEEIAAEYIQLAKQSLAGDTTEHAHYIKEELTHAYQKLTSGEETVIRRRRQALYAVRKLIKDVDISFNYDLSKNINMALRMLRPGWLDSIVKRINAGTFRKNGNSIDEIMLIIDTQFDRILQDLDDPKHHAALRAQNDPLSTLVAKASTSKKDIIWELVQKRLHELLDHYEVHTIGFQHLDDIVEIPEEKPTITMRHELQTMMYDDSLPMSQELSSGILYSRYCGLLLELVAAAYFVDNGYEILYTGQEVANNAGIYLTELDLVVRDPDTEKISLVEVKSMRSPLNMKMILNSKVRYKLETYREKKALIEKRLGLTIDEVTFVIDVGHQHYLNTFLQSHAKELEQEYGFPVSFIPLSMGAVVEEHTGFIQTKKRKTRKPKVAITEKEKNAKRRAIKAQKKIESFDHGLESGERRARHIEQRQKREERRNARRRQRQLITSLHGIVEPALNSQINTKNLYSAEDVLEAILAGKERVYMAVNEPALEAHERRMIHYFTANRGIHIISVEDLLHMKEQILEATRFIYVGLSHDDLPFPKTVRRPDASVYLGKDKVKRTLLLSNFPLLINALLSNDGEVKLDGQQGIFTDFAHFIEQIGAQKVLEEIRSEMSKDTFKHAA
jgi:predicted Rossmann-fold nucleotide-binding protein/hydroxymethylpyrimidine pyrophosphatase-like HAD family hydrolase